MRITWLVLLLCPILAVSQENPSKPASLDLKTYPQSTPREALSSVLQAIDSKQFDYLVTQLADPAFVQDRVKRIYGGRIEEQILDTKTRLDPVTVKLLKRFAKQGTWTVDKQSAVVKLDDVRDRVVRFVKKNDRWYLSNDSSPGN